MQIKSKGYLWAFLVKKSLKGVIPMVNEVLESQDTIKTSILKRRKNYVI